MSKTHEVLLEINVKATLSVAGKKQYQRHMKFCRKKKMSKTHEALLERKKMSDT